MHAARLNSPLWDVYVVDQQGHPVQGASVTEIFQNYSCEADSHEKTLFTDAAGHVQFAAMYLRRNPLKCIKNTASNLGEGVHASLGRDAYLIVRAKDLAEQSATPEGSDHWSGSPAHVVVHLVMRPIKDRKVKWQKMTGAAQSTSPK